MLTAGVALAQTLLPAASTGVASPVSPLHLTAGGNDDRHAGGPGSFADLAEKVEPAVIGVTSKIAASRAEAPSNQQFDVPGQNEQEEQDRPSPAPSAPGRGGKAPEAGQLATAGSGFFISSDGYAVTSSHVVEDSGTAQIRTHDDKIYTAKVVGKDPESDLALLKIDGRNDFSYVKLADHPPRVGDWVLAVGNPFGLGGTVTAGIISAQQRSIEAASAEDLIQIDAPINTGDSGGPSFDVDGNVIGVNSMMFSPSGGSVGIAFAVPADTVKVVIPQLKDKGSVTRGWIGAMVQSITPDLADGLGMDNLNGALVTSVQNNSPAAKAGLASGDVITAMSGQPVGNAKELVKRVHTMAPGSSETLDIYRQQKKKSVSVTIGQLPSQAAAAPSGR